MNAPSQSSTGRDLDDEDLFLARQAVWATVRVAPMPPSDIDDAISETVRRMLRYRTKVMSQRERIALAVTVARNVVRDAGRKRRASARLTRELVNRSRTARPAPVAEAPPKPMPPAVRARIREMVTELAPHDRRLIWWYFYENQPLSTIAARLKCSTSTAFRRVQRAVARLENIMHAHRRTSDSLDAWLRDRAGTA